MYGKYCKNDLFHCFSSIHDGSLWPSPKSNTQTWPLRFACYNCTRLLLIHQVFHVFLQGAEVESWAFSGGIPEWLSEKNDEQRRCNISQSIIESHSPHASWCLLLWSCFCDMLLNISFAGELKAQCPSECWKETLTKIYLAEPAEPEWCKGATGLLYEGDLLLPNCATIAHSSKETRHEKWKFPIAAFWQDHVAYQARESPLPLVSAGGDTSVAG